MQEQHFFETLLGLSDLRILSIEHSSRRITLSCELSSETGKCPNCGEPTSEFRQYKTRKVRDLDISGKEVWLHLRLRQFHCIPCTCYFTQSTSWLLPYKSYTKRQQKWVFDMCAKQPFTEVGAIVNMNAKTVERLYYEQVEARLDLPARYRKVRKLGIDEIAHRKGKKDYACVLVDLERNIELDVLPNRKKATLVAHFKRLGKDFCEQIEVVCCDIWKTYIYVAQECFPNADVVLDRFHIVKALNEVLDAQRKRLRKENKDEDVFKDLKWKLSKRVDKCSTQQIQDIEAALNLSDDLRELYDLRNNFHTIFDDAKDKEQFEEQLYQWIEQAQLLENEPMSKFIKTIQRWMKHISTFALHRITNAATEGLNNYIRYFKRISFGLPNFEHMRLRILAAQI